LVQNVFLSATPIPRVVVFAGIDSGNGCSEISARSAETLASHKLGSVCLVDANFRSPILSDSFGATNHYGLADSLREQGTIRDFSNAIRDGGLWLLSAGSLTADCPSLLSGDRMKARMAELRKEFDYVLVDAPALNAYADGIALGQLSDGLVVVVEADSTRREVASNVVQNLRAAQIRILGAVLNKRRYPIPESLYRIL
jgi:Mrp family chromosome partitioning ATPase